MNERRINTTQPLHTKGENADQKPEKRSFPPKTKKKRKARGIEVIVPLKNYRVHKLLARIH